MYVPQWPSEQLLEVDFVSHAVQLHGCIGSLNDIDPDNDRRVVGFRMRPSMVGRFPRTAALSFDGKTWQKL
jgi:hypothetical protein